MTNAVLNPPAKKSYTSLVQILTVWLFLSASVIADEAGEIVTLKFDMEAGLTSRIELTIEQLNINNGKEQVQLMMTVEGRSRVEDHSEGLVIIQNFDDVNIDGDMGEHTDLITSFMETVLATESRYVISNSGEFLGIEGLEPVIENLQRTTDTLIDNSPEEVKPKLKNLFSQLKSKDLITAKAKEEWFGAVEQWLGAEFELGYYYSTEYSEQVPAFGGVELGFEGSYEYLGKTNCNEIDTENSCVELTFQSSLLPDSAKRFTDALFKQMNLPVLEGLTIALDTKLLLVTEPDTLKPHYTEQVKTVSSPNGGGSGTVQRIDRNVIRYFYD